MKRYAITYREGHDGETETVTRKAYSAEHAEERLLDELAEEGGIEGVQILKVTLAP